MKNSLNSYLPDVVKLLNIETRLNFPVKFFFSDEIHDRDTKMTTPKPDLVALWKFTLPNGKKYKIEFEHGTTTGKRVLSVNSQEIYRKDWMFKLVGHVEFEIATHKNQKYIGKIEITPHSSFTYEYSLFINNKPYEKFKKERSKTATTWVVKNCRITLEKATMEVYVNGNLVDSESMFGDEGAETHFVIDVSKHTQKDIGEQGENDGKLWHKDLVNCVIKNVSSGDKREGLLHILLVDKQQIAEVG